MSIKKENQLFSREVDLEKEPIPLRSHHGMLRHL